MKEEPMAESMKQYKLKRGEDERSKNRGAAQSCTITRSENDGYIVRTDFAQRDPKGPWPRTAETVHETIESAMTYVQGCLGKPHPESAAQESAEAKAAAKPKPAAKEK